MEEGASLRLENLHKKAFSNFDFRTATKLDDLISQRKQFAQAAYKNINGSNVQVYFDGVAYMENEIKRLLSID